MEDSHHRLERKNGRSSERIRRDGDCCRAAHVPGRTSSLRGEPRNPRKRVGTWNLGGDSKKRFGAPMARPWNRGTLHRVEMNGSP